MDNNNKPLYKVLNEARTQGIVKVTTASYLGFYELEFPDTTNLCTVQKVNDNNRYFANAEYTALAVNNLHHLAEMLEKIAKIENKAFSLKGFDVERLKKGIAETLKRIS